MEKSETPAAPAPAKVAPPPAKVPPVLTREHIVMLLGEDCPKDHEVHKRALLWAYPYRDTKPLAFLRAVGRHADTGFAREFVTPSFSPEPGERKRYRLLQKWPEDPYKDGDDVPVSWQDARADILFKVYRPPPVPEETPEPYTPKPWTAPAPVRARTDPYQGPDPHLAATAKATNPEESARVKSTTPNNAPSPAPEDDPVYRALAELLGVSVQDAWQAVTLEKDPGAIAALLGVCTDLDAETIKRRYGVRAPIEPHDVPDPHLAALAIEPDPYATLRHVLDLALEQASSGKGKERHDPTGARFENQQIVQLSEWLGSIHFNVGQACKKSLEACGLETDAAQRELLGAINYLAAAWLVLDRAKKPRA